MKTKHYLSFILLLTAIPVTAGPAGQQTILPWMIVFVAAFLVLTILMLWIVFKMIALFKERTVGTAWPIDRRPDIQYLNTDEISLLLKAREARRKSQRLLPPGTLIMLAIAMFTDDPVMAQSAYGAETSLLGQPGVTITLVLIMIPLFVAALILIAQVNRVIAHHHKRRKERQAAQLADYLMSLDDEEIDTTLLKRKAALDYELSNTELGGTEHVEDVKGVLQNVSNRTDVHFVATKKKAAKRPNVDPRLSRLILWYLASATFWLLFGTTIGEYLGIKFVAPDVDRVSWLSFGRLRPVHTNAVFWGWASLAMIGLGHYVVSIVSNSPIASIRKGWLSLWLINSSVAAGSLCLMAGINNAGGEYREYVWPVMALFGGGLAVTLTNFIQTIARRTMREIYISNWYIVSAIIFTLVIVFIAYWPTWQNGLGETVVQGYYMHQGVGMWFMLFSLGIVYYFLPQQLNKPIYSYSLGILAFWTQILFYTIIGTHHFVFSAIPWWLQTVAIVGSMGMLIPVLAGTTNFLMTFKGDWTRIASSYTLPFYIVGIVLYFTGSFQGTAEAFRYTNLLWHFTDFTVAHSHITMYGIITFLLWASIYALVPRLTGNEPSQLMVGVHFWLAFIGLLFYSIPLMIGGTMKGLAWMDGKPFIDSVTMMAPYWLWRAIGGSMMWLAHVFFAYNFYKMINGSSEADVKQIALEKIRETSIRERDAAAINGTEAYGNIQ